MQFKVDQLLRKEQGCVVTLRSPRGKVQAVLLMLLDLGQSPRNLLLFKVLPLTSPSYWALLTNQYTDPLVQLLPHLQVGHLDVHSHMLLHIRHRGWSCEPSWCSSAVWHVWSEGISSLSPGSSLHLPGTGTYRPCSCCTGSPDK